MKMVGTLRPALSQSIFVSIERPLKKRGFGILKMVDSNPRGLSDLLSESVRSPGSK
jgi:hypothetical protein